MYADGVVIVNGVYDMEHNETIATFARLLAIENGKYVELATSNISEDGTFTLSANIANEGFYAVDILPKQYVTEKTTTFYFKPGDVLNVKFAHKIGGENLKYSIFTYELEKENTPENKEMAKWNDFLQPLISLASNINSNDTYVTFFPILEQKLSQMASFPKAATPNKKFNSAFEDYKKYDFTYNALIFNYAPRMAHPIAEDYPDFYRKINVSDLTKNASLLNYPNYSVIIANTLDTKFRADATLSDEEIAKRAQNMTQIVMDSLIVDVKDKTIKGELTLLFATGLKTLESANEYQKKYGKYLATKNQKERLSAIINNLRETSVTPK